MRETEQIVYLVDDDTSFRTSMKRLLSTRRYTVKTFVNAEEFLDQRPADAAGCAIVDLQMPGMCGMRLQQALRRSGSPLPVIFLTGHGDIPTSVKAMRDGAEDFLQKTASQDVLLAAIERALARDVVERRKRLRQDELRLRFATLTPRENEVLSHVLRGRLNKQIAADLGIDERSVKRHRSSLMAKLAAKSVVELAQLAEEAQIRLVSQQPDGLTR